MNIHIMTLFPEMVMGGLNTSITGRAISKGILSIEAVNIRDYSRAGSAWQRAPRGADRPLGK